MQPTEQAINNEFILFPKPAPELVKGSDWDASLTLPGRSGFSSDLPEQLPTATKKLARHFFRGPDRFEQAVLSEILNYGWFEVLAGDGSRMKGADVEIDRVRIARQDFEISPEHGSESGIIVVPAGTRFGGGDPGHSTVITADLSERRDFERRLYNLNKKLLFPMRLAFLRPEISIFGGWVTVNGNGSCSTDFTGSNNPMLGSPQKGAATAVVHSIYSDSGSSIALNNNQASQLGIAYGPCSVRTVERVGKYLHVDYAWKEQVDVQTPLTGSCANRPGRYVAISSGLATSNSISEGSVIVIERRIDAAGRKRFREEKKKYRS